MIEAAPLSYHAQVNGLRNETMTRWAKSGRLVPISCKFKSGHRDVTQKLYLDLDTSELLNAIKKSYIKA